jgi:hypothetical protein
LAKHRLSNNVGGVKHFPNFCATAVLTFFIPPFYLCLEHVDNLGAYIASRPETGLLIPSDFVSYLWMPRIILLWPQFGS